MSGENQNISGGNTHPSYDENNRHLSRGNNYQISAHSSYGDLNHQPIDNNNCHNRPQSNGDFNHRNIDEIDRRPLYGDIDHHQPKDDNNRPNSPQSYGDSNHQKIDEINRRPFHGDIDHQTYHDEKTRHLSQDYKQFDEYTHPKYGHINDQNIDKNNRLSRIPVK